MAIALKNDYSNIFYIFTERFCNFLDISFNRSVYINHFGGLGSGSYFIHIYIRRAEERSLCSGNNHRDRIVASVRHAVCSFERIYRKVHFRTIPTTNFFPCIKLGRFIF